MTSEPPVAVILLLAGGSSRMGGAISKVLRPLAGIPVLAHSLDTLSRWNELQHLVLVLRDQDRQQVEALVSKHFRGQASVRLTPGGAERFDSVWAGLQEVPESAPVVLVHDAARPLASLELFRRVAGAAAQHGAAIPGLAVTDTIKRRTPQGLLTLPREQLFQVQTPQGFRRELLVRAHSQPLGRAVTDDAMLLERLGEKVELVAGELSNRKITQADDLELAESLLRSRQEQSVQTRMGMGEDLHRLEDGGPLRLGGVDVEGDRHAVGHSDADALLHAVTDAILGALALGDIGQHFSDRAAENRGRDSAEMLRHAVSLAAQHGYRPLQMDSVVHLERPRLSSARDSMRGRLAELLGVSMEAISIKAKTGEGLGEVGRAQAIVCQALVQLGPL